MMSTASRTTASLSDAKKRKTELRCQFGRAAEAVAGIGEALFSARCAPVQSPNLSTNLVLRLQLSENRRVKKPIVIAALFVAPFFAFAQAPSPSASSSSGASSSSSVPAQKIDSEKERLIRDVLARTKEVEQAQERIAQGMAGMKQMMPRLPEKYWEKYRSLISESELTARLIRVYDQRYTTDELKSLLDFTIRRPEKK